MRDQLSAARAELAELREAVGARKLSVASLMDAEPGLLASVTGLEQRETELTTPHELAGLMAPGADVAARWTAAPMSARREVVLLLCVPTAR